MRIGKAIIVFLSIVLFSTTITGCSPSDSLDEGQNIESSSIISPSVKVNEQYYRGVLPYKTSPIGGMLKELPSRLDTNHFELGLLELAKTTYDPSEYVFQEGQVLTMNEIEPLLDENQYPQYEDFIYAVSEHDYLYESGEYGGVVVGLLVSSEYMVKDENGKPKKNGYGATIYKKYTDEEIREKSRNLIQEIASVIQTKVPKATILFGIMKVNEQENKVPGTFILSAKYEANENEANEWNKINEGFLFLPSNAIGINDQYGDVARGFNHFKEKMDEYLPGFAGITGIARIVNQDLLELTVKVYTEFDSTVEVIQFTQFAISMLPEYFPEDIHVNLYVNTIDQPKAIYIKQANGDDFMHIYRN